MWTLYRWMDIHQVMISYHVNFQQIAFVQQNMHQFVVMIIHIVTIVIHVLQNVQGSQLLPLYFQHHYFIVICLVRKGQYQYEISIFYLYLCIFIS